MGEISTGGGRVSLARSRPVPHLWKSPPSSPPSAALETAKPFSSRYTETKTALVREATALLIATNTPAATCFISSSGLFTIGRDNVDAGYGDVTVTVKKTRPLGEMLRR